MGYGHPFTLYSARLLLVALLLSGCVREEGRVLQVVERLELEEQSSSTLAVDSTGRFWLGGPAAMLVRDSMGRVTALPTQGTAIPRVLGWVGGRTYLQDGETVIVSKPGVDSAGAARPGFGDNPVLVDVRGRGVLEGSRSGAVLGYDPQTLEALWAWPALALRSTALAASPFGDRVYQAVGAGDDGHRVLIRDLQTGRVLATVHFPAPFQALIADGAGILYGLVSEGRGITVLALRPRGEELELIWRRRLPSSGEDADVRLAEAAGQVAVWGLGDRVGLRLLDGTDGAIIGRTRIDPLDAAFGPAGKLWVLHPGELRLLR